MCLRGSQLQTQEGEPSVLRKATGRLTRRRWTVEAPLSSSLAIRVRERTGVETEVTVTESLPLLVGSREH